MNSTKFDAPVCLVSRVSVPRGGAQPLNFANMASRSRGWLRISELRFMLDPGSIVSNDNAYDNIANQYGQNITIDAGIGRHRITNGQVPVWMLGPRLSYYGEIGQQSYLLSADTSPLPVINSYVWKFPRPVLVPPGTSMGMLVSRPVISATQDDATILPNAMTVEVAAVGVRLASPPKSRETDMPYVTYFRTLPSTTLPLLESGQGFAAGQSLANPFTKPLLVERFNQRTAVGVSDPPQTACDYNTRFYNSGEGNQICPANIRLRMFQDGYEVISETVPKPQTFSPLTGTTIPDAPQGKVVLDTIFNPQWATWRVNAELAAKKWYNAEFSCQARSNFNEAVGFAGRALGAVNYDVAPMLSMVGSRKEFV